MPIATYISPIGTSLLANFSRSRGNSYRSRYRDLDEWYKLSPGDDRNKYPEGDVCRALEDRKFLDDAVDYAVESREKSCAEVNGILGIQKIFSHRSEDVELVLMYTRLCNTRVVSYILREALQRIGFRDISMIELKGIANTDEFDLGLLEILDKVAAVVGDRKSKGYRVYVNATPGYKSETGFLMIVSMLLGIDAAIYIHESFNTPVLLPSIPITIKKEELEPVLKAFGGEGEIPINAFLSDISHEKFLDLKSKGLIEVRNGNVSLRPWIRRLLNI